MGLVDSAVRGKHASSGNKSFGCCYVCKDVFSPIAGTDILDEEIGRDLFNRELVDSALSSQTRCSECGKVIRLREFLWSWKLFQT